MDLRLTDEELSFRDEVREYFATALPADIRAKCVLGQRLSKEELERWQKILHDKGWATPAWAPEWGGTGWSADQAVHLQGRAAHGAGAGAAVVQRQHDRPDADCVRHRGTETALPAADLRASSTGSARASPSRARVPTSPRCAPRPCATAITTSSTARNSGRRPRTMPTGASARAHRSAGKKQQGITYCSWT